VNPYYPIALKMEGRLALVVGGGVVARRKVESLIECGARVRVVAPEAEPALAEMADAGGIELRRRPYEPGDLEGAFIAIAATDAPAVNTRVAADARARGVLVNSVDKPEECDFIATAVVRRGDLLISIFTGGSSPALSKRIREQVEALIGPEYGDLVALLGKLRPEVMAARATERERTEVWRRILDSDVPALVRAGRVADAEARAREMVHACDPGGGEPPDRAAVGA